MTPGIQHKENQKERKKELELETFQGRQTEKNN